MFLGYRVAIVLRVDSFKRGLSARRADATNEKYWLGLYNFPDFTLDTYWLDGSNSTFRRWAKNEPDDDFKRCIYFEPGGKFKDSYCTFSTYRYVCKKSAGNNIYCDVQFIFSRFGFHLDPISATFNLKFLQI